MRSEYAANQALQATAPAPAWTRPSTCKRPARVGLIRRLLNLITR